MFQRLRSTGALPWRPSQVTAPGAAPSAILPSNEQDTVKRPARQLATEERTHISAVGRLLARLLSPRAIPFLLLYGAIYSLYFYMAYNQVFNATVKPLRFKSDLPAHLAFAARYFAGQYVTPEPGLYILWEIGKTLLGVTLAQSAIVIDPLLVVSVAIIIRHMLAATGFSEGEQLFYTAVLMVVTPILDPLFGNLYLGQFSSTIYHNPTLFAVKPFAYLSFILLVKAFDRPNAVAPYVWAALAVAVSVVMKPNFVLVFAPALGLLLLLRAPL